MQQVGELNPRRIQRLRKSAGMTRDDLAFGIRERLSHDFRGSRPTATSVRRWENGTQPVAPIVPALAAALGVAMEELYAADEDEESSLESVLMGAAHRFALDVAKAVAR